MQIDKISSVLARKAAFKGFNIESISGAGKNRTIERKGRFVYKESKFPVVIPIDSIREKQADNSKTLREVGQNLQAELEKNGIKLVIPRYKLLLIKTDDLEVKQIVIEPFNLEIYQKMGKIDTAPSFMHQDDSEIFEEIIRENDQLRLSAIKFFKALGKLVSQKNGLVFDFVGVNNLIFNTLRPDEIILTNSSFKFDVYQNLISETGAAALLKRVEKDDYSLTELRYIEHSIRLYACLAYRIQVLCKSCGADLIYKDEVVEEAFGVAKELRKLMETGKIDILV